MPMTAWKSKSGVYTRPQASGLQWGHADDGMEMPTRAELAFKQVGLQWGHADDGMEILKFSEPVF